MTASKKGIQPRHARKLAEIWIGSTLHTRERICATRGADLHPLRGQWTGFWAVKVSGNWRVIFRFEEGNALQVNYLDYH